MKSIHLSSTAGIKAGKVVKLMYGTMCGAPAPVMNV